MYTYKYPMQTVTADAVVVCDNQVLLIKRNTEPFKGCWALPGGHLDVTDRNTEETAWRELKEETGIDVRSSDVLYSAKIDSYDEIDRDPRGRYVTIAYFYHMCRKPVITIQEDEVNDYYWCHLNDLNEKDIAFDHFKIISDAKYKFKKEMAYGRN